jgi:hypothetical protein
MPPSTLAEKTTTITMESEIPEVPSYFFNEVYVLRYKDRSHIVETHFGLKSVGDPKADRQAAIKRGMLYCDRCRYRFIHCEPFLTDLDATEAKMCNI